MSRYVLQLCCLFALISFSLAQKKTTASSQADKTPAANPATAESIGRLPVKRVVLYKNGVGYFEHSARVHGSQDLTIDFTTAQLNDVLKSLTVVDLGEGRISGVRYNSIAPLDERLKALRLPFGESITQADFLAALRGARVEARSGSVTASGRLLSVETEQRTTDKGVSYNVTKFSVITDAGEMRNFELGAGTWVRLAERDLTDEVGKYLSLIGSSRARDLRRMTISATGSGDRNIFVSYISEVPVWKSTYRIILPRRPATSRCCKAGRSWTTRSAKTGKMCSFRSWPERRSRSFRIFRSLTTRAGRWCELPPSVMLTPQEHEGTVGASNETTANGEGAGVTGHGGAVGGFVTAKIDGVPADALQFQTRSGLVLGGGSLAGIITDPSGAAISGAQVAVRNAQTGVAQSTTTDPRGAYQFYSLTPGSYAVSASYTGFKPYSVRNVRITIGHVNTINATLSLGGTAETVRSGG